MAFTPAVQQLGPFPDKEERSSRTFGVGPYARASASLYAQPNVAVTLSGGYRRHPAGVLGADSGEYAIGTSSGTVYEFAEIEVRPLPFELFVGVSWHL